MVELGPLSGGKPYWSSPDPTPMPPNPASPRPPRGGSGQSTAKESTVGYQPTSQGHYKDDIDVIYGLKKEVEQLQVANNELTAELYRYQERERLEITGDDQLARNLETAEDDLWETQGKLAEARSNLRGYATLSILSGVAVGVFCWGVITVETTFLLTVLASFGAIFALVFLSFGFLALDLYIKQIPAQKRVVATKQRHLDRLTLKELGLS